ncbi:hypothetical protein VNO78_34832 [Psophocarpus tetragonolobus]|uniref:Uncharacterized protein n=2 Tax=Psophocarpus tetragonolobus TaxID=3891 RepID=A0AAN9NNH5_PSOTE
MFRSSFPLLRKSEPPVQVQDTIITAWTIRHPTRNRNDPIARAELYQLSYIPRAEWSMHEGVKSVFYSFPWRSWAILDLNQRPRPYVVRCSVFIFPLRPNLNLCSRDNCPYTDKGCMNSREERSRGGPPRIARIPRVKRKLDLHWISPESPHLSS